MSDPQPDPARTLLVLLVVSFSLVSGCRDLGTGGSGELVVPPSRLRHIEDLDLHRIAEPDPAPATQVAATQPATRPAPQVRLGIDDVRRMALQNNLELRVELIDPTIAQQNLGEERARFEWLFITDVFYGKTDSPTASQLSGSQTESINVTPGLTVPLQTGGTVRLNAPLDRFQTNNQFSTLNPAYTSDLSASISHPLLRGLGSDVTAYPIRIAFYNAQASEARAKSAVIRVLTTAERVYWRLYAARQLLEVRRKEYDLAAAQLERARRQIAAGVVAEVDVVRAESGVADTVERIILAENLVRDRQRDLKRILNEPGLEMDSPTAIVPHTPPAPVHFRLDRDRVIDAAMTRRMELLQAELQLAQQEATVQFARNQMLPILNLDYTYNINGLGSELGDAVSQTADNDFADHRVGLRLELPLGNAAARSRYRSALASRLQALASRQQQAQLVQQEVYNAIDQLEANWQRILATRQRVILAARTLDVETRQFELGLRTSTDVLDAQTRLADAQAAEIDALAEYQIAQVDIAFATGTVLGQSKVVWQPVPVPNVR